PHGRAKRADLVMSLDNVIAVAAAAKGSMVLLILGLAISIPLVIFGSTLMIKVMERFPIVVVLGAGLIGWVAGETITSDVALHDIVAARPWLHYAAAAAGAVFVISFGKWLAARAHAAARAKAH
ncbi:MAG: TerC family protein, partial [Comamonadaceae bacterium]